MEYSSLTDEELREITRRRFRELEVSHFQYSLEEQEEPGLSKERTIALAELVRRISHYRSVLGIAEKMEGESLERDGDKVVES